VAFAQGSGKKLGPKTFLGLVAGGGEGLRIPEIGGFAKTILSGNNRRNENDTESRIKRFSGPS